MLNTVGLSSTIVLQFAYEFRRSNAEVAFVQDCVILRVRMRVCVCGESPWHIEKEKIRDLKPHCHTVVNKFFYINFPSGNGPKMPGFPQHFESPFPQPCTKDARCFRPSHWWAKTSGWEESWDAELHQSTHKNGDMSHDSLRCKGHKKFRWGCRLCFAGWSSGRSGTRKMLYESIWRSSQRKMRMWIRSDIAQKWWLLHCSCLVGGFK